MTHLGINILDQTFGEEVVVWLWVSMGALSQQGDVTGEMLGNRFCG